VKTKLLSQEIESEENNKLKLRMPFLLLSGEDISIKHFRTINKTRQPDAA
jgi:hypothetical protein